MMLAEAPLTDVSVWARSNLIQAVLLLTGTILLTRFASWASNRYTSRIAVAQVVTWAVLVVIYCVVAVLIVSRLGFPISGFVAPASIAGVAIGFGAQRVVQDVLSGFLIVSERQYGYGDIIRLAVTGNNTLSTGTVEEVTLRTTRIRSLSGEVITTPNGQIVQVTNLSRDWARVVVDVPVPARVDLAHVTAILRQVCADLYAEEDMRPLLLDPPNVMGVESLEVDHFNLRVVARTLPGKQFEVGRDLRSRITLVYLREGITLHPSLDAVEPTRTESSP
jgi:small conductance mechanosensitive channel